MKWIILFTSHNSTCDEWEEFEGSLDDAVARATCDLRHLNYGRNGFRIIPDIKPSEIGEAERLKNAIRSFQTDFERIKWGWDGDCGSADLADHLFTAIKSESK